LVREAKRIDTFPIGQEGDRARPVGAPHAAVEAECIKDAGERVPNVAVGEGFMRERAGTADLYPDVAVGR
jgi:hypothetical protein